MANLKRQKYLPENPPIPLFVTWKPNDKASMDIALAEASKGYQAILPTIQRSSASAGTFRNIDSPHVSVRDGFNRNDYDYFRPGERLPQDAKGIQSACRMAYHQFGIVRNMIDMMTDFIVKGITVVHTSTKIQEFGQAWFKKVHGKSVSGKIVRRLLREASAPVRRKVEKIKNETLNNIVYSAKAKSSPLGKGEIPLGYKVLNPINMEVIGGELTQFVDDSLIQYGIKIPDGLLRQIKFPKTQAEKEIIKALKPDLYKMALSGETLIPVEQNRLVMLHYKKDDDQLWPIPLLGSILDELQMYQKLKMADRSALDGAISHIRLWKMGDLANRIIPNQEGIQNLADILLHSTGGGCVDLVWGPDLELVETNSDMYQFLGSEKYNSTMTAIYQGLGVPPSLTGIVNDTGSTNNFVSLRVLVERLEYCREVLIEFWVNELDILRSVFGFRNEFKLSFAIPSLTDDSAEKKLLIDLIDRDLISAEFVQERFNADPLIENARINQDRRKRDQGIMPPKAGQFHIDSQQKQQLEKSFVQLGEVTPSQVGLNYPAPKKGEKTPNENQAEQKLTQIQTKKPPKTNGRPIGTKDSVKRPPKKVSPKQNSKAKLTNISLWANASFQKIDDLLKEPILKLKNKSNMRQLTDEETNAYEDLKFSILCNTKVGSEITLDIVKNNLSQPIHPSLLIKDLCNITIEKFIDQNKAKPTLDQVRQIRTMAYALYILDEVDDGVFITEE